MIGTVLACKSCEQGQSSNIWIFTICGSVEWGRQTMFAQGTLLALSLTIGCLFLELRLLLLLLITRTASIVFSTIAHNFCKATVYGLVDSNFKNDII